MTCNRCEESKPEYVIINATTVLCIACFTRVFGFASLEIRTTKREQYEPYQPIIERAEYV